MELDEGAEFERVNARANCGEAVKLDNIVKLEEDM